jgi:hypothetical protein
MLGSFVARPFLYFVVEFIAKVWGALYRTFLIHGSTDTAAEDSGLVGTFSLMVGAAASISGSNSDSLMTTTGGAQIGWLLKMPSKWSLM